MTYVPCNNSSLVMTEVIYFENFIFESWLVEKRFGYTVHIHAYTHNTNVLAYIGNKLQPSSVFQQYYVVRDLYC